jgi:hypothetical protein
MRNTLFLTALSIALLSWPTGAAAQCSTYGGRATVVQASGLNIAPVVLSDTGNINSTGGVNDASFLNASVPGLLTGEVLSATAIGAKSFSHSVASLANLNLTVAGNTVGADFVAAHANADCGSGGTTISGTAEIDALVVNGLSIVVTGSPNQTVSLLGGGYIILNEQTLQNGSITVNAMHVTVPGVADVVIDSAFAAMSGQLIGASGGPLRFVGLLLLQPFTGINIPCPTPSFFTGGGWISAQATSTSFGTDTSPTKKTFGVSGGTNPGGNLIGHLEYVDHGLGINVHGTGMLTVSCAFDASGVPTGTGMITGTADVNGQSGCSYAVILTDNDTTGGNDNFSITLSGTLTGTGASCTYSASADKLGGGNIEFHGK